MVREFVIAGVFSFFSIYFANTTVYYTQPFLKKTNCELKEKLIFLAPAPRRTTFQMEQCPWTTIYECIRELKIVT